MQPTAGFQLSLYGKTSWERCFQATKWILEPCSNAFPLSTFQCLVLDDGQAPVWCEGVRPTSLGASWTPNITEGPHFRSAGGASSLSRIMAADAPQKFYLSPAVCSKILRYAATVGCPPPKKMEYLLIKQGGRYPQSTHFRNERCAVPSSTKTRRDSCGALENQLTLFPPYSPER